jgi:thioredoxin reductase
MAAQTTTDFLIIGAGPFGLATAARCRSRGIDHAIVGSPLSLWRHHMPEGMCLRLGYDWHLCPNNRLTFRSYLDRERLEPTLPLTLARFIEYGDWFIRESGINVWPAMVTRLQWDPGGRSFIAETEDGTAISARAVLCTPGLSYFRYAPEDLINSVAPEHRFHSADFSKLEAFADRRCLIIGGRQSAFELAALLAEHGAYSVSIVLRHPTPQFSEADLDAWVPGDLERAEREPGWFASQPPERRLAIQRKFWIEGRSKLEPWLAPRLEKPMIEVIPNSEVASIERTATAYCAHLQGGAARSVEFDVVIFATGFRIDLARVPYLRSLTPEIMQVDGFPALTPYFESRSLPGVFFAGVVATRDFGPYVGFIPGCGLAARTIVGALEQRFGQ